MHRFSLHLQFAFAVLSIVSLLLAGCGRATRGDELGQAFVASATLNLRREIAQKNGNVATLKHGERVSIIDVRRRFVKIRTSNGLEGWVDSLQLLSTEQMDEINRDAKSALALPSEGKASVFEALNVHIQPSRLSPAFARIEEGAYVDVLAHKLSPKAAELPKAPKLIQERPQPSRRSRKERGARDPKLPPRPAPPKPPTNWQELSGQGAAISDTRVGKVNRPGQEAVQRKNTDTEKPAAMEDWTLIRTKNNESGWVLSRNLVMAIPDEVAQYAEGKHITSYFELGLVQDEEKGPKHNWLWTTSSGQFPYDFNAWRVFLWNRHRHRYETSYRQRDLEGYYPVKLDAVDANTYGRTFHLLTKDDDGKFRDRTYIFDGTRVHLLTTEDASPGGKPTATSAAQSLDPGKLEKGKPTGGSWFSRQWQSLQPRFSRPAATH